jgi:hypothetical protein
MDYPNLAGKANQAGLLAILAHKSPADNPIVQLNDPFQLSSIY